MSKSLEQKPADVPETVAAPNENTGEKPLGRNATSEQANDNGGDDQKDVAEDLEQKTSLSPSDAGELNLKSIEEEYLDKRETAKLMMYLIDVRDRKKVTEWLKKLDSMTDEEGQLERLLYVKYLVMTLSGMFGLVEPFTSSPPEILRPLRMVLPPLVFADVLEERPEKCFRTAAVSRMSLTSDEKADEPAQPVQDDRLFYTQQLFPPEGVLCYAAAFSTP